MVGTNDRETKFRVLEIDRTQHTELKFREDQNEYDAKGIRRVVSNLGHCKVSDTHFEKSENLHFFILNFFHRKLAHMAYLVSYNLWKVTT